MCCLSGMCLDRQMKDAKQINNKHTQSVNHVLISAGSIIVYCNTLGVFQSIYLGVMVD